MSYDFTNYGGYGDEKKNHSAKPSGLPLGAGMELPDGRIFRLTRLGATAAVAGCLYQGGPSANANTIIAGGAIAMGPSAAAIGAQTLTVTATGTAFPASSADFLIDGYMIVASSAGNAMGQTYKLKSVAVATSGSALNVTLAETESIITALQAGTSFVQLIPNSYDQAILSTADTVGVGKLLGVACASAAASTYVWMQTRGLANVLADATNPIVGCPVVASSTVAGAVATMVLTGTAINAVSVTKQALPVGYARLASGTTLNHIPVDLTIE